MNGGSYDGGVLVRLKHAEALVKDLQQDLRSATTALERERKTRHRFEREANELKGHLLFVYDHCGRQEWQKKNTRLAGGATLWRRRNGRSTR